MSEEQKSVPLVTPETKLIDLQEDYHRVSETLKKMTKYCSELETKLHEVSAALTDVCTKLAHEIDANVRLQSTIDKMQKEAQAAEVKIADQELWRGEAQFKLDRANRDLQIYEEELEYSQVVQELDDRLSEETCRFLRAKTREGVLYKREARQHQLDSDRAIEAWQKECNDLKIKIAELEKEKEKATNAANQTPN